MYQALYRKYRSKTFDELVGQQQVTKPLKEQIRKHEVSHAYLFTGTRGTGKTSAAKIMARAVNCLQPINGNPCNTCEHCTAILSEKMMDVVEMDAASNNGVDDIRELKERVVYPPATCKYKVYIIDEVHMLSKGAFNALLKILEEPPAHLIFILATTEPRKLPQTILSRCQRFQFKRISIEEIMKNMERILEKEGKKVDPEGLKIIALHSGGAMRDALSLLDQCLGIADTLSYHDVITALGMTNIEDLQQMVHDLLVKDGLSLLQRLENLYLLGKDIPGLTEDIIGALRNILILKETNDGGGLLSKDDIHTYKKCKDLSNFDFIIDAIEELGESLVRQKYSMNPKQVLEMTFLKITSPKRLSLEERIAKLEKGHVVYKTQKEDDDVVNPTIKSENEKVSSPSLKPKREDKREEVSSKGNKPILEENKKNDIIKENVEDIDLQTIKNDWQDLLLEIKKRGQISIYGLLRDGSPIEVLHQQVVIGYDMKFNFHVAALNNQRNLSFLEQVFSDYYHSSITVKVVENTNTKENEKAIEEVKNFFGEDTIEII